MILHLGTYGENSAPSVPTACGVACSTWDAPLQYVWEREKATCPACLLALPQRLTQPPIAALMKQVHCWKYEVQLGPAGRPDVTFFFDGSAHPFGAQEFLKGTETRVVLERIIDRVT